MKLSLLLLICYIIIVISTITNIVSAQSGPCCMCDGCIGASDRANTVVDNSGMTCQEYIISLASKYDASTSQCSTLSSIHYDRCCTNGPFVLQKDSRKHYCSYVDKSDVGPFCNLCANGRYPLRPNTISTIHGVAGNPSCANLYCLSRRGHIPKDICRPMQDFMDIPCGCYNNFEINPDIDVNYKENPKLIHTVTQPRLNAKRKRKFRNMMIRIRY